MEYERRMMEHERRRRAITILVDGSERGRPLNVGVYSREFRQKEYTVNQVREWSQIRVEAPYRVFLQTNFLEDRLYPGISDVLDDDTLMYGGSLPRIVDITSVMSIDVSGVRYSPHVVALSGSGIWVPTCEDLRDLRLTLVAKPSEWVTYFSKKISRETRSSAT